MKNNQSIVVGIIFENQKELIDLLNIARSLASVFKCTIKIISPSKIYIDKQSEVILNNLNKNEEVYYIEAPINQKFSNLSSINKFLHVRKVSKNFIDYFDNVTIVLSGIQTIFERVLYKKLVKKGIPFFVYHRHLIFGSSFKKMSKLIDNCIVKYFINILNINELITIVPNIGFASKYLVLGEVNANYLMENGVSKDDIFITGSLEYDDLSKINVPEINNTNESICYITGAYEWHGYFERENNQRFKLNNLIKFVQNKEYKLTIRVHPREDFAKYYNLQKKYPFISLQFPSKERSVIEDLIQYNYIIGGFSTAMFEIALLKKPVLFYCLENERTDYQDIIDYLPSESITNDITNKVKPVIIDIDKIISYNIHKSSKEKIINHIKELF